MIGAHELIEHALRGVKVADAVVIVSDVSDTSLRWAGNSMTTNGVSTSRTWVVVAFDRQGGRTRVGTVSSTSVDPAEIAAVVRAAEDAARSAEPAVDTAELVQPDATPTDWGVEAPSTGVQVFDPIAGPLGQAFEGADALYGFASHTVTTVTLGTTTGVRRRYVEPVGSIEINGKRGGLTGASAWAGAGTADFTDVDVDSLLHEIERRLNWAARRVELPAGRYETIMPPSTVADMMIYLMWTMEGRGAQEGRTALSAPGGTRVGERLGTLPLTLISDPRATGLEYAPFVATGSSSDAVSVFDNGLGRERVTWVRDGVIDTLAYPRAIAAQYGAPVAQAGENLIMSGGSEVSVDEMIARTERGLLLTTLWYIREVDPATLLLTGLTRDGVYVVEDGAVTGAVNNFRFNESPLDLLRRATEAGRTEMTLPREWKDWFTRTAMPPLRIPDFHMSSVSKAQ